MKVSASVAPVWLRGLAVLLIASVTGCGTTHAPQTDVANQSGEPAVAKPAHYRLPPDAKVAVALGQFDPKITFIEFTTEHIGRSPGAFVGNETLRCVRDALFQTVGLFIPLCAILGPVAGAISSTIHERAVSTIDNYHETTLANSLTAEEIQTQKLAAALKSDPLERSLLEQVQRLALDRGLHEWVIPLDQAAPAALIRSQYQNVADYIYEISVTGLELGRSAKDVFWIRFNGKGRLLRVNDNVAVDHFTPHVASRLTFDRRQAETDFLVVLKSALRDIAVLFVDRYSSVPAAAIDSNAPRIFEAIACIRPDGVEIVTTRILCVQQSGAVK